MVKTPAQKSGPKKFIQLAVWEPLKNVKTLNNFFGKKRNFF